MELSARSYDSSSPPQPAEKKHDWNVGSMKSVFQGKCGGDICGCVYREVILKELATIFQNHFTVHAPASHSSFLTWLKRFFGAVVGWLTCRVGSYDSRDTEHARLGNVLRASSSADASPGLAGPPACGRGGDGRLHKVSSRCSAAQMASLCCLYILHHQNFVHPLFVPAWL